MRGPELFKELPFVHFDELGIKSELSGAKKLSKKLQIVLVKNCFLLILVKFLKRNLKGFHHSFFPVLDSAIVDLI